MSLTLQIAGSGAVTLTGGATYSDAQLPVTLPFQTSTLVQITAIPEPGWRFLQWTGEVMNATNPLTLNVEDACELTAVFVQESANDNHEVENANANDNVNENANDNASEPTDLEVTDVKEDTTLPAGTYRVADDITVHDGATLTLEAGARLEFARNTRLLIDNDGVANIIGTETRPVVLTAQDPTPGYWRGVSFSDSNSSGNILEHVIIEYGGVTDDESSGNITIQNETRVIIRHCTLRHSASMGFAFNQNAAAAHLTFEDNVVTGNALGAGKVLVAQMGALDSSSTFSGNAIDRVLVGVSSEQRLEADQTWRALDVDYEMMSTIVVYAHLVIEPGVRLAFQADRRLAVNTAGTLAAIGTADQPIVFTAVDPTPGFWLGIEYGATNSASNVLRHFVLEYAGRDNAYSHGALTIWNNGRVQVDHGLIQHSAGWGIYARGAFLNDDIEAANSFEDVTLGTVELLD